MNPFWSGVEVNGSPNQEWMRIMLARIPGEHGKASYYRVAAANDRTGKLFLEKSYAKLNDAIVEFEALCQDRDFLFSEG